MARFHVNDKGEAGSCHATQGGCPFGGESGHENHYGTLEEARSAYESSMAANSWMTFSKSESAKERTRHSQIFEKAAKGNKRALRKLADDPMSSPSELALAAKKAAPGSRECKALEAHDNFPTYALSADSLEARLDDNVWEVLRELEDMPSQQANDTLALALSNHDLWGESECGRKVQQMLADPENEITDEGRGAVAKVSEIYAEAAARSGRFPTQVQLGEYPAGVETAASIVYSIRGGHLTREA